MDETTELKFKDYFSQHAEIYSRSRPGYPTELFDFLAKISPDTKLAWDCATGNGQAALSLSDYFEHVIASDASKEQISHAIQRKNILYMVVPAEHSSITEKTVDLITVATAIHWFKLEEFYQEVNRVLKPNGVIAVWAYDCPMVTEKINKVILHLSNNILKNYWPKEVKMVNNRYQHLPFPFQSILTPKFITKRNWNMEQLMDFMMSWSSSQNYLQITKKNPLDLITSRLKEAWEDPNQEREVCWEIYLKAGKKT